MEEKEYIEGLILRRLNREASPAEEAELQQWLDADPGLRQNYQALEKIWLASGPVLQGPVFDKEAAWERMRPRIGHSPDRNNIMVSVKPAPLITLKRGMAAAAVLLILVSAGWWFAIRNRVVSARVILAQHADQQVSLPDGSVVTLRKGAMIKYTEPFTAEVRQVEMSGEVFFQLAPHPGNAFRISTSRALIEDIGTSFMVKDRDGVDEVTVATGKIKFTDKARPSQTIVLVSGQRAVLKDDKFIQSAIADSNFMAWKTGVMNFRNTPLDEAVQEIGDFYQLAVSMAPELRAESGKIRLTARFEHQSLEAVLEEVRLTTGLTINHEKNTLFFHRQ